jgi:Ca2+-binding EF-hand superfamily protein
MRRNEVMCELNVLAQFKKYDVSRLHRGFITPDGIRDVLEDEGISDEAIDEYIQEFMALDTNGDGKVSFLDLYESMMTRVPDEWLEWIDTKFKFLLFCFYYL